MYMAYAQVPLAGEAATRERVHPNPIQTIEADQAFQQAFKPVHPMSCTHPVSVNTTAPSCGASCDVDSVLDQRHNPDFLLINTQACDLNPPETGWRVSQTLLVFPTMRSLPSSSPFPAGRVSTTRFDVTIYPLSLDWGIQKGRSHAESQESMQAIDSCRLEFGKFQTRTSFARRHTRVERSSVAPVVTGDRTDMHALQGCPNT